MRLGNLLILAVMVMLASCGSSRSPYTDRVKELSPEDAHPRYLELARLVASRPADEALNLVSSWKKMLVEENLSPPLVAGTTYTFVYFDTSNQLDAVWMDASFSEGEPIPLWRWESTRLFYRTFSISRPDTLRYRFVVSEVHPDTSWLSDALHSAVDSADSSWSVIPDPRESQVLKVDAVLEPGLVGQSLRVVLPPDYDRDVTRTWPLLVLLGQSSPQWHNAAKSTPKDPNLVPVVIVSLEARPGASMSAAGFSTLWTSSLKPWLVQHLRLDATPSGTFLLGWGDLARVAQDVAANHSDHFGRSWTPPPGTADTDESWNQNFAQILKTSFTKVAP